MSILADATPVVFDEIIQQMPESHAWVLSELFGNEIMIDFLGKQREIAWTHACTLSPIGVPVQDYHDTMSHLHRVTGLWEELQLFAKRCRTALIKAREDTDTGSSVN